MKRRRTSLFLEGKKEENKAKNFGKANRFSRFGVAEETSSSSLSRAFSRFSQPRPQQNSQLLSLSGLCPLRRRRARREAEALPPHQGDSGAAAAVEPAAAAVVSRRKERRRPSFSCCRHSCSVCRSRGRRFRGLCSLSLLGSWASSSSSPATEALLSRRRRAAAAAAPEALDERGGAREGQRAVAARSARVVRDRRLAGGPAAGGRGGVECRARRPRRVLSAFASHRRHRGHGVLPSRRENSHSGRSSPSSSSFPSLAADQGRRPQAPAQRRRALPRRGRRPRRPRRGPHRRRRRAPLPRRLLPVRRAAAV